MMGRKQVLLSGDEIDVIECRSRYCYLINNPSIVKKTKRRLNKRFRRQLFLDLIAIWEDLNDNQAG